MEGFVYRSKVDWWIAASLALGVATCLWSTALGIYLRQPVMFLSPLILVVVLGGLVFPVQYEFESEQLIVRSGFIRYRIPYAQVESAEPSRALWSSPALSIDRIIIRYNGRFILISPADKESFLRELRTRCRNIA